eukprot:6850887-Prymnesium_polylepis.1
MKRDPRYQDRLKQLVAAQETKAAAVKKSGFRGDVGSAKGKKETPKAEELEVRTAFVPPPAATAAHRSPPSPPPQQRAAAACRRLQRWLCHTLRMRVALCAPRRHLLAVRLHPPQKMLEKGDR